ncbi:MAG: hypothetical protein P8X91_09480, partial [Candidatus Bathyarchaeota archaeon]
AGRAEGLQSGRRDGSGLPYGPADTVSLPGVMKLGIGEKVLFFGRQEEDHVELLTYLPFLAELSSIFP